jgi:hypothetical protein
LVAAPEVIPWHVNVTVVSDGDPGAIQGHHLDLVLLEEVVNERVDR